MQVSGQNIQQQTIPPQINHSGTGYTWVPAMQQTQAVYPTATNANAVTNNQNQIPQQTPVSNPVQQQVPIPQTTQYPAGYTPVQNTAYPPYVPQVQPQAQTYQVPASASGVNIQIFNPSVTTPGAQAPTYNVNAPCYPSGYYTGQMGTDGKLHNNPGNTEKTSTTSTSETTETTKKDESKKTEKRKIVQLTDDYIKNLENYLNSPEKDIRLNAAKEVYARLEEDDSRRDDKALTALINKMLQDPSTEIRFLALTALESRIVTGDDFTVGVLQKMQQNPNGDRQEAVDASSILLKMSGNQVEKEFEVKEKPKSQTSTTKEQSTSTKKS